VLARGLLLSLPLQLLVAREGGSARLWRRRDEEGGWGFSSEGGAHAGAQGGW